MSHLRATNYQGRPSWYRCRRCGSEALFPQPGDERLGEIYGPSYYEPWTWERAATVQMAKERTFLRALDLVKPRAGQHLLDVGCAQGELAASAVNLGLIVAGVDLNPDAIVKARLRVPQGTFFCGQIDTAATDQGYEIITMFDFIEHVRDPVSTLSAAASLLTPRGVLLISTPRVDSVTHRVTGSMWPQYREEHLHMFSASGLAIALASAGLRAERAVPTTKFTTVNYLLGQMAHYGPTRMQTATNRLVSVRHVAPLHWLLPMRFGEMTVVAARN